MLYRSPTFICLIILNYIMLLYISIVWLSEVRFNPQNFRQ